MSVAYSIVYNVMDICMWALHVVRCNSQGLHGDACVYDDGGDGDDDGDDGVALGDGGDDDDDDDDDCGGGGGDDEGPMSTV